MTFVPSPSLASIPIHSLLPHRFSRETEEESVEGNSRMEEGLVEEERNAIISCFF
jgi:hypothetical protein